MRVPLPIVAACFIIAIPVIIPIAVVLQFLRVRRLRIAANKSVCPMCGSYLGTAALTLADAAWRAYVVELHRLSPGAKLRLVRLFHAICPACGQQLRYDLPSKSFIQLKVPQVAPTASKTEEAPWIGPSGIFKGPFSTVYFFHSLVFLWPA